MSEDAIVRLAQACPSLRCVTLQNTKGLTDRALTAFFENCANLSFLEISTLKSKFDDRGVVTGTAFDFLGERPEMAPKLKTLRVADQDDKAFMKRLREFGRERGNLLIQLVNATEMYEGETELWGTEFRKGRKSGFGKPLDRWRNEPLDPGVYHEKWRARKRRGY